MKSDRLLATVADYQATFGSPQGKRVLRHLIKSHGFLHSSFVEKDPYSMAFNEGGRNAIIQIINKLKLDIKRIEYELLHTEEDLDVIS